MHRVRYRLLILLIFLPTFLFAQNPAKWSLDLGGKSGPVKQGESLKAVLQAEIESGWHLYATDQPEGGPIPTTIKATELEDRGNTELKDLVLEHPQSLSLGTNSGAAGPITTTVAAREKTQRTIRRSGAGSLR